MSRVFMRSGSNPGVFDIWDIIDPKTYEPVNGWIELTKQADTDEVTLNPTVEAGVVNALQAECGETARDHGFSRDWEFADYLEVVSEWLTKGGYQTAEMYVDIDKRPPEDLTTEQGRYPAGDLVWVAAQALRNNILCTKLMLIVTELSEGVESLRKNGGAAGALEGKGNLDEELADAIVRILDTGTFIKANLGDALLAKMATNRDRPYMHGDKAM